MSVKVEKLEKGMAKLTIEVSAEELEKAVEKVYQKQKGSIRQLGNLFGSQLKGKHIGDI